MSERFIGGVLSATPPSPTSVAASGVWTLEQAMQAKKAGNWPAQITADPQFNYVTMLLHGDGTNGAQNNTFLDSSSNNFTITRNGNTTQGSFSPYGSNWSNYFSGSPSSYLQVANNAALQFGTGDFTVEGWFFLTGANFANNSLFSIGSYNGGILLRYVAAGTDNFYINNTSYNWNPSSNFLLNRWNHVALVRNGSTVTIYVNGTSVFSVTNSSSITQSTATSIGTATHDAGAECCLGHISNFRIVKGTAVYTSAFTPPTAPLTAISGTSLLTCQSNRFVDNSTNNFVFTTTGDAKVQRFNPFGASTAYSTSVIGGSGYFDGSGDSLQATAGAVPAIGTSDFTISGWWYLNELKDYQILFDFRNGSNSEAVPYVYMDSTGTADYYVNATSHTFSVTFKPKQWSYMVISRVSGTTKVFVNGAQAVSYADSVNYVAGRLTLGFNNNGASAYYYSGYISDFKVVIGTGTTSGTPTTAPATATSGTQALLSMTNGAIFDNAMITTLETVGNAQISTSVKKYGTGSLSFDGTGDYLTGKTIPIGSGDFTIECWVYLNVATGDQHFVQVDTATNTNTLLSLDSGSNKFRFVIRNDSTTNNSDIYSSISPSANTWYHIAGVVSGGSSYLFVNGSTTLGAVGALSGSRSGTGTNAYLGVNGSGATRPLNGYLDDVRITAGYARYTANFTPPTAAFQDQ